jgi:hypothetical protein
MLGVVRECFVRDGKWGRSGVGFYEVCSFSSPREVADVWF